MRSRMDRMSLLVAVLVFCVGTGCISYVSYQTADTIPKGAFELGFGYSATSVPDIYYVDEAGQTQNLTGGWNYTGTIPNILPDIMMRFGLGENLDLGMRLFALGIAGDLKWRIVNTSVFSLAIAPSLFYSRPFIFFDQYGAGLPVIFTVKIGEYFKIYGGGRAEISGWRLGVDSGDNYWKTSFHTFGMGANIGVQFGGRWWWIRPEFGYMRHFIGFEEKCTKVDMSYFTYGLGFGFIFGLPSEMDAEQQDKIKQLEERLDRIENKPATDQPPPAAQPPPPDQPKSDETDEIRKRADDAAEDLKKEEDKKEQQ